MKKYIFCICLLQLLILHSNAQNGFENRYIKNQYDKLIKKYDVINNIKTAERNDISDFWNILSNTNKDKQSFENKRNSKLAKESLKEIAIAIYNSQPYYDNLQRYSLDDDMNKMFWETICGSNLSERVSEFCIISDNEPNAFSTPNGGIYITDKLVDLLTCKDELVGILAHEMAHFQLQHALVETYKTKKIERNNKVAAVISSAAVAVTEVYSQVTLAEADISSSNSNDVSGTINNLFCDAKRSTQKFHYKYSKNQEIEADIIAFRFLEWTGLNKDSYINALKLIKAKNPMYEIDDTMSDHPSIDFRIGLLEYLSTKSKR